MRKSKPGTFTDLRIKAALWNEFLFCRLFLVRRKSSTHGHMNSFLMAQIHVLRTCILMTQDVFCLRCQVYLAQLSTELLPKMLAL